MTEREFIYRYSNKSIHCDNIVDAKIFIKLAYSFGYSWIGHDSDTTFWTFAKENTTYTLVGKNIKCGDLKYRRELSEEIIKFDRYENKKGVNLYELNS